MDAESQLVANLDTEIERLKALIIELCDELEGPLREADAYTPEREDLLQRAREATK